MSLSDQLADHSRMALALSAITLHHLNLIKRSLSVDVVHSSVAASEDKRNWPRFLTLSWL